MRLGSARGALVWAQLAALLLAAPAFAGNVFKCKGADGVYRYQYLPCEDEKETVSHRVYVAPTPPPEEDSAGYGQPPSRTSSPPATYGDPVSFADAPPQFPSEQPEPQTGFVRCTADNGRSFVARGDDCPQHFRRVQVEHRPGMVLDVTTGQQTFMVPGGGNGMIDPRTGQRHELISPPPTRNVPVPYERQAMGRAEACRQAKLDVDRAWSEQGRNMDSIRAARARYQQLGC